VAHARTQIRAAVVAALATTGYPVVPGRAYPDAGALPALTVYTDGEAIEPPQDEVMGDTAQFRTLALDVEGRAQDVDSTLDDALDAVCLAVERAMAADVTFGGIVEWSSLRATAYERTGDTDRPTGVATMRFDFDYRADSADPEQIRT